MASRYRIRQLLRKLTVPLATSAVMVRNGPVGIPRGTFTAGPASGATDELSPGFAIEDVDQTAGDTVVQVALSVPVNLEYGANDTNTPIVLATDFQKKAYWHPDGYITLTDSSGGVNYAFAGTVWDVHSEDGVGVKPVATEVADLLS